jgi:hypothetical protein
MFSLDLSPGPCTGQGPTGTRSGFGLEVARRLYLSLPDGKTQGKFFWTSPRRKSTGYQMVRNGTGEQSKAWQGNGRETQNQPIVLCHRPIIANIPIRKLKTPDRAE